MHEISIGRIFFKRNLVNVIYQQSCNLFRRYFLKFCSVTYKNKTQVGQQIAISSYSHILISARLFRLAEILPIKSQYTIMKRGVIDMRYDNYCLEGTVLFVM